MCMCESGQCLCDDDVVVVMVCRCSSSNHKSCFCDVAVDSVSLY